MHFKSVLMAAALAVTGCRLSAQGVGKLFLDDITWAGRDFGEIWLSPFRSDGREYLIAAAVMGGAAAISPFDDEVDRWAVRNHERGLLKALGPVRRGGSLYTLNRTTPYVGAAYIVALATNQRGWRDGIMGCASAYAAGSSIRHMVVYPSIGRNRPDTQRDRPEGTMGSPAVQGDQYKFRLPADGWPTHSFPGGHVATMATCASFFAHRYDVKYLDPTLITLVTAMGIGRIADRGHWFSDQLIGVAMGYAIGREVARRQLKRLDDERSRGAQSRGTPGPALDGAPEQRTLIGWRISF
jgi:membrane-associated phospholipid phosphatase